MVYFKAFQKWSKTSGPNNNKKKKRMSKTNEIAGVNKETWLHNSPLIFKVEL